MKKILLSFSFSIVFITILAGQKTVTGVVVDEIGIPLPGASVVEVGTTNGVSTDFDGNSGGIEFLPIKLFNILPATLKTEIFLARAKSVDDSVVIFLAFGSISGISGFCKHKKLLISILKVLFYS